MRRRLFGGGKEDNQRLTIDGDLGTPRESGYLDSIALQYGTHTGQRVNEA